jgi:hypothetical protein
MADSWLKGLPWRRFTEFISPDADRFAILKALLEKAALEYKVLDSPGSRHFIVSPPPPSGSLSRLLEKRPPTMLVAHYDRAEGSPGANDNSAGVFLLLETAKKLVKNNVNNWSIIFTDKEELKTGEGLQEQGSYGLAKVLKNSHMENSRIFCFDTCGSGDTLIVSATLESLIKKEGGGEKLRESMMELRKLALNTARDIKITKIILAPTPFSDDAGFFRAGFAAQTITMLPTDECKELVAELKKNREYPDILINAEFRQNTAPQFIPETWRNLNSPNDTLLRLTPENFKIVVGFADALCRR